MLNDINLIIYTANLGPPSLAILRSCCKTARSQDWGALNWLYIYRMLNDISSIIYTANLGPPSLAVLQQDRKIARLGGPKLAVYIIELISFNILYIYSQFRAPQSYDLTERSQDHKIGGPEIGRIHNRTDIIQHPTYIQPI